MGNITGTPDFTEGFTNTGLEYFVAHKTSLTSGIGDAVTNDIVFDTLVSDTFTTSEYNTGTGVFTATRTGFYWVSVIAQLRSDTADQIESTDCNFRKNGSDYTNSLFLSTANPIHRYTHQFSVGIPMVASDTFKVTGNVNTAAGTWTIFGDAFGRTSLYVVKLG